MALMNYIIMTKFIVPILFLDMKEKSQQISSTHIIYQQRILIDQ